MKVLAALAIAAFGVTGSAFGGQTINFCDSFDGNGTLITGTIMCPAISLGAISSFSSAYIILDSDFSSGRMFPVTEMTTYTLVGAPANQLDSSAHPGADMDILTTTAANPVAAHAYSESSTLLGAFQGAPPLGGDSGFVDNITLTALSLTGDEPAFSVNFSNRITSGRASGASGYIEVVYNFTPAIISSSPEPVSMILFGSGLLAISLVGRRKFAQK